MGKTLEKLAKFKHFNCFHSIAPSTCIEPIYKTSASIVSLKFSFPEHIHLIINISKIFRTPLKFGFCLQIPQFNVNTLVAGVTSKLYMAIAFLVRFSWFFTQSRWHRAFTCYRRDRIKKFTRLFWFIKSPNEKYCTGTTLAWGHQIKMLLLHVERARRRPVSTTRDWSQNNFSKLI